MPHPKDRPRLTRGQFVRGAAGAAVSVGVAGTLAGCENTTTPIGACEDGAFAGGSPLVEAKPAGPGGLPLPRNDNSVTWAITDDNPMLPEGGKPEGGTLRLFNYADYLYPGLIKQFEQRYDCKIGVATYNSADEAVAKLSAGTVSFDVILGLSGSNILNLMARQLLQPLNHAYLPNLEKNIWPELADPFYDRGSRYTVPYVVWQDGIGWRNDKLREDVAAMDVPWDIFWQSAPYRGKVGLLDDKRDGLSMPMQRDAMRSDSRVDVNTEDPEIVAKAGRDLAELADICNIKVTITDYQTLPEAKTWLHHSWSGDLLSGAFYYLPSGVSPDVLSFWGPETGGVVQNDYLCITRAAEAPVLAHAFLDFMLEETNAYENFVQQNGYIPPQRAIDAEALVNRGLIPKTLASAVTRPDQFAVNQELLQLTVEGERLWDQAWSKFRAG
ncbi:MAG TPA: spermidine/putrescine ABC transporter substrate-binding protein [Gaiellaceae bacterium]|nr:spermidine/putrescine ABC transporter substrate-binding protein [Gaiellaceae bacterium]